MRIEVGADGEELGALGLAGQRFGALALRRELGLEIDVAAEAEAADEVERHRDEDARGHCEEAPADR